MDILKLQQYQTQDSGVDGHAHPLRRSQKKKPASENASLHKKGGIKSEKAFLEFFINGIPLFELLDKFYNSKRSILENWIGVLGLGNPKTDIIKLKQLLGKKVLEKEIRDVYPSTCTNDELEWGLDKYKDELNDPKILVYCCAQCGDYDCGGIAITIERSETSTTWKIDENGKMLKFEFDRYLYYEELNRHLIRLSKG